MKVKTGIAVVNLVGVTPNALELLLETKNTRLKNAEDVAEWNDERKMQELAYMLDTIKSSWEFVDYTFLLQSVTRAFTHQLVRTRSGSYAQQSQRTVDVRDQAVLAPDYALQDGDAFEDWISAVNMSVGFYEKMVDNGMPIQDARGILPTNMTTDIFCKFNLRTLHDMAKTRLCTRTQGEYQDVFRAMRQCVLSVHPWAEPFLQVHCVATGTCAFPRYGKKECKFYDSRMDLSQVKKETHELFWSSEKQVAVPVSKEGKTM